MQIELTPEQEAFVNEAVANGRAATPANAIHTALNLWVERERVRLELLTSLDDAMDSIEAGRYTEYTEETIAQLPAAVADRCRARLEATECASA